MTNMADDDILPGHPNIPGRSQYLSRSATQHYTESDPTICMGQGELTITVFKAKDTKGDEMLGIGRGDPYAKVTVGQGPVRRTKQTKADQDAGSEPTWNENLQFLVTREDMEYNELSITLFNKNRFRSDTFLGHFKISNLGQLVTRDGNNKVPPDWYPVIRKGMIQGRIMLAFTLRTRSLEEILMSMSLRSIGSSPHASEPDYEVLPHSDAARVVRVVVKGLLLLIPFLP